MSQSRSLWMPPSGPSRRSVLRTAVAGVGGLLGAGALAGCSGESSSGAARVDQWNLFGGGDGARLVEMDQRFADENADVAFRATTLAWGAPFYTKLAMSAAGGRSPDTATMHLSRLPGFAPGRLLDPIPLDLLAAEGITEADFLPAAWEKSTVDGQLYAVPLDTHPYVMYFRTDICGQAGVLEPDGTLQVTRGADELVAMLNEVKAVTGKFALSTESTSPWRLYWALYRQLDGEIFDGDELVLDDAKSVEALAFIARLADEGLIPRQADYPALVAGFSNGDSGLAWNGEWEVTTYQTAETPFDMTPFPDIFGNRRTYGDSHTFVLPHQRDRDPAALAATVKYIAWMLKNSADWAAGGHIPAYQPVAQSEEYLALKPQSNYRDVAPDVQYHPEAWFSGSGSVLETEASAAFTGVVTGTSTPEQSNAQWRAALESLLATPSPV